MNLHFESWLLAFLRRMLQCCSSAATATRARQLPHQMQKSLVKTPCSPGLRLQAAATKGCMRCDSRLSRAVGISGGLPGIDAVRVTILEGAAAGTLGAASPPWLLCPRPCLDAAGNTAVPDWPATWYKASTCCKEVRHSFSLIHRECEPLSEAIRWSLSTLQ
jgi:hypothetical protein